MSPRKRTISRQGLSFICVVLCIALAAVSIFSFAKITSLNSKYKSAQKTVSSQQEAVREADKAVSHYKGQLETAQSKADFNESEMRKYRKLVHSLESTNKEQRAIIESLTLTKNGRDDGVAEPEGKIAYLTFDDGPSEHTEQILDILNQKDAVATFFVINTKYNDKLPAIIEQGSAVAMHSYTHKYDKMYKSVDAYFEDLKNIEGVIYEKTGCKPKIVRLPGGSSNTISKQYCKGVVTQITQRLNEQGYVYFDWNVDSTDASKNGVPAATLLEKVKSGCKGKDVVNILMHDTAAKKTTVEALPQIIDFLKSEGYQIRTLSPLSTVAHHHVNN